MSGYIFRRRDGFDTLIYVNEKRFIPYYINYERITALRKIKSKNYDLRKLIKICEEINFCYENQHYYAVVMLSRVILDHIPLIFGHSTFKVFVSNYKFGTRSSFRENMEFLEGSARKIADNHVHSLIKEKEDLLTSTQINFSPALDMLLLEIINVLNKQVLEIKVD
jgi:hypothetical protein